MKTVIIIVLILAGMALCYIWGEDQGRKNVINEMKKAHNLKGVQDGYKN